MPTIKPRTTVTLEPSTHEVIERLAVLQGRSRGSVISEMLDSIAPALTRTVAILEAAAVAPLHVKQGFRDVVEGVQQDFLSAAGKSSSQLNDMLEGAMRGESDPHVVTRGSGSTDLPAKASSKTARKPSKSRGVDHD